MPACLARPARPWKREEPTGLLSSPPLATQPVHSPLSTTSCWLFCWRWSRRARASKMPVRRRRTSAQASAEYAWQKWCRQQRAAAAAATAAAALPTERYARRRRCRQQRAAATAAAAAATAIAEYAPRRRDARKPLSEVQERGCIRHDAGLPRKTCGNCGAANYACLSYAADPERFWCCDGGSTGLPPLGDYPELL